MPFPPPRTAPRALAWGLALLLALFVAACGGDDSDDGADSRPGGSREVAQESDFPAPAGKTMAELREGLGPGGPVLAPTVSVLQPGTNRLGFGLFDRSRRQISDAPAAVYVAPASGGPAAGPFFANAESLSVAPPFQSQTVKNDPDSARSIYVAQVKMPEVGQYEVMGVVKLDGRLVATEPARAEVAEGSPVPDVGERPPKIETPTVQSVGGDVKSIDTRVPPGTMHDDNFADVLGKRPIMLIFSTPALCQVRVCGPVVDIAEQVKASNEGDTAFIHMEIYEDNELEKGFRPQVTEFNLPTEPWAFTIDRDGKVAERLEGAFSESELREAVKKAEAE
jgi:hypothetical protein